MTVSYRECISEQKHTLEIHANIPAQRENIRVGQDNNLQHLYRQLLDLGNGELPIVELPDKIQIPAEFPFEIDDAPRQQVKLSLKQFVQAVFS